MAAPHVHLQSHFQAAAQPAGAVGNALFDLLAAVHAEGSIQRAATALGVSYRHVWGALKRWEAELGQPLVGWTQGHPARLTPAGLRLLIAERMLRARQGPQIDALRAEMEQVLVGTLEAPLPVLAVAASPEPLLAALRQQGAATRQIHLRLLPDTSWGALRALSEGRCSVAAVHRPPPGTVFDAALADLQRGGAHRVLARVQRQMGLMLAAGNPRQLQVAAALTQPGLRVVVRPPGSGSRALLEKCLPPPGVVALRDTVEEPSHEAAALAVACGLGHAAFGSEAAARAAGLAFVPLLADDWLLLCAAPALADAAVQALQRALQAPAWQAAVAALPGHRVVPE
jgi:putative molybdopterin biosynthesis protein